MTTDSTQPLTQAQARVLALSAEGLDWREIAAALVISPETVRRHRTHIMQRLGARNMTHAVTLAFRAGLLD